MNNCCLILLNTNTLGCVALMTGLWGYANQLIAVIAVRAILEDAVDEPFRGRTKEGDVWKCGGEGVLESLEMVHSSC